MLHSLQEQGSKEQNPSYTLRQVLNLQGLIKHQIQNYSLEGIFRKGGLKGVRQEIEAIILPLAQKYKTSSFPQRVQEFINPKPLHDQADEQTLAKLIQQADEHTWAALAKQTFQYGNILDMDNLKVLACWHSLHKDLQRTFLNSPRGKASLTEFTEKEDLKICFLAFLGQLNKLHKESSLRAIHNFMQFALNVLNEQKANKMIPTNVAMVFAPCILGGLKLDKCLTQTAPQSPHEMLAANEEFIFAQKCILALIEIPFFHEEFAPNTLIFGQQNYPEELKQLRRLTHFAQPYPYEQLQLLEKQKTHSAEEVNELGRSLSAMSMTASPSLDSKGLKKKRTSLLLNFGRRKGSAPAATTTSATEKKAKEKLPDKQKN